MDARIAELGKSNRRPGHDTTVRIRHVAPEPRRKPKPKRKRASSSAELAGYAGWTPKEKPCRREGCTNTFQPAAPAQAYCSSACRVQAIRGQRRTTDKGKRERRKARLAEAREPVTRVCALDGCDTEFAPEYPRSLYCSPEHTDEARRRSRRRSEGRITLTPATRHAIAQIERLEAQMGERLPELARDYLVLLWTKVQTDPNCPEHIFARLERMLGLPPVAGSTMPPDVDDH